MLNGPERPSEQDVRNARWDVEKLPRRANTMIAVNLGCVALMIASEMLDDPAAADMLMLTTFGLTVLLVVTMLRLRRSVSILERWTRES